MEAIGPTINAEPVAGKVVFFYEPSNIELLRSMATLRKICEKSFDEDLIDQLRSNSIKKKHKRTRNQ
jgi:hypothetical protein